MDDDVRVEDVGKRMESVIRAAIAANQLTVPFDLIVHSTGGLVAREWLSRFYPDGGNAPVKRVIMLAPANFGSRLASLGKSMIGRVIVGSRPYASELRQIVNENGSDGTVRCAAANLNAVGMTVDFSVDANNPEVRPWSWRSGQAQFPFAVLPDRDHSSIHEPLEASGAQDAISQRLGDLILAALACNTPEAYQVIYTAWQQTSEQTADLS